MSDAGAEQVLAFWYSDRVRAQWFAATPELDAEIRQRFEPLWHQARDGALEAWRQTPDGCLALIIVLDQFPLNMFRGLPRAFATEAQAIAVVRQAVDDRRDQAVDLGRRGFLYMPLMHSEDLADQDLAVALYAAAGLDGNLDFARHHREIIRRFGRFPHRNAILGRASTDAERAYLASDAAFTG